MPTLAQVLNARPDPAAPPRLLIGTLTQPYTGTRAVFQLAASQSQVECVVPVSLAIPEGSLCLLALTPEINVVLHRLWDPPSPPDTASPRPDTMQETR